MGNPFKQLTLEKWEKVSKGNVRDGGDKHERTQLTIKVNWENGNKIRGCMANATSLWKWSWCCCAGLGEARLKLRSLFNEFHGFNDDSHFLKINDPLHFQHS